jgi:hypothetical protein
VGGERESKNKMSRRSNFAAFTTNFFFCSFVFRLVAGSCVVDNVRNTLMFDPGVSLAAERTESLRNRCLQKESMHSATATKTDEGRASSPSRRVSGGVRRSRPP